jgi:hypothetical protein
MTQAPTLPFEPPDTIAALPPLPFEFSAAAAAQADAIIAQSPEALFLRLLNDQESEAVLLVARRVIDAFIACRGTPPPGAALPDAANADEIAALVAATRAGLAATIGSLATVAADTKDAVLRQRAPLGLLSGCWLDVLSQPATQPSVIVNRLFAQHYLMRGAGQPQRSLHFLRRHQLEVSGVCLPEIGASGFLSRAHARPLTALHGSFYLALSRLPASFLPELVGVHYVHHTLGIDDLLSGLPPMLPEAELRDVLACYLDLAGQPERQRLHTGIWLALALESEHVAMLAELAAWHQDQTLESKVAAIIARHAPYAGSHHGRVRVGSVRLSEAFTDPDLDIAAFLAEFRESRQLRPADDGLCRFVSAFKFGGPMFGIFDEREAATFTAWVQSVQAGERPEIVVVPSTAGDAAAAELAAEITVSAPADVVIADPPALSDRELFYRLINIEHFANTLPLAAKYAARLFDDAEILFRYGAGGRYTDATYFDYRPDALYQRCEQVYWEKLIKPYRPLTEIPDADEVIFLQTTFALGSLIDAAWIHRTANLGRCDRPADAGMFAIYADEVGFGDLRKNHITLIHRALHSMNIKLPHIRDAAFMHQAELPDDLYGFSLFQLCMALFPDTYYSEILGYNLAIEMVGLGELRLHEIQKLRHHGFDDCYEQAHLTIDNISAGHSKQAADIIVVHLDGVRRALGEAAMRQEWHRVWRGYASVAYFVEPALLKQIAAGQAGAGTPGQGTADQDRAAGEDSAAGDAGPVDLMI